MAGFRHAFLLLPRFSLLTLAAATEPLAALADARSPIRIDALLVSLDGRPVRAGSGILITPDLAAAALPAIDALFVVADTPLPERGHEPALALIQSVADAGKQVGGIGTGTYLLARAGVLKGYRATIHWPYSAVLAERFPDTVVSSHVFEIDRQRATCAGGSAALDLTLALLRAQVGEAVAMEVANQIGAERLRRDDERQRTPLTARAGASNPKLAEAVALMEANFEEPLPTEDIARLVGVSRRQLERLFKQHLNTLPSRYYLEVRLQRAHQLLRETGQSILQIGLSCGFSSGPHFSSAYRNHFGITPREERSRRAQAGHSASPA